MPPSCHRNVQRFYPRHPRGWRRLELHTIHPAGSVSHHATLVGGDDSLYLPCSSRACFYPRHPRGWRLLKTNRFVRTAGFYPRHPRGWRLCPSADNLCHQYVSIHATLVGGDPRKQFRCPFRPCFYPRHPRGWRHSILSRSFSPTSVSIHATLVGGDLCKNNSLSHLLVSIHATLVGGDTARRGF